MSLSHIPGCLCESPPLTLPSYKRLLPEAKWQKVEQNGHLRSTRIRNCLQKITFDVACWVLDMLYLQDADHCSQRRRGVDWGWRAAVEGGVAADTLCFGLQTEDKLNLAVTNTVLIVPLKGGVRWRWGQACVHVVVSTLPAGLARANLRQRWLAEKPLICSNNTDVSKHLLFFHRGQQRNNKVRLGLIESCSTDWDNRLG